MGIHCGGSSKICLELHRAARWSLSHHMRYLAMFCQIVNRLLTGADIDVEAEISPTAIIPHTIGLVIGATAIVENAVILMPHVVIGALNSTAQGRRHPHVQEGALIGAGAKLLGPITVGKGAKIGANAVVLIDVPAGATVIGIPGRIVRTETTLDTCLIS